MKLFFFLFFLAAGLFSQAQQVGYGAGRPRKGPVLPPVKYAVKKDTVQQFTHRDLTVTIGFVSDDADFLSGMKVEKLEGDTTDKNYVNTCILQAFDDLRKQYRGTSPGKNKTRNNRSFFFPAN